MRLASLALTTLMLVPACTDFDSESALSSMPVGAAAAPPSELSAPLEGMGGAPILGRLIGIKRAGERACPALGIEGWGQGGPLFGEHNGDPARLPQGLQKFCLYHWEGGQLTDELLNRHLMAAATILDKPTGDRPVVAPMANDPTLFEAFADSYLARTWLYGGHPVAWKRAPLRPVHLQLLDTHPDVHAGEQPWTAPGNEHGLGLANIARDLTCDESGVCAAMVGTTNAMPLVWQDPQTIQWAWDDGGEFGSIGALAQSIWNTVYAWDKNHQAEFPLVMNLSLAWHTAYGGLDEDPGQWPADVQAVHAALLDAQCRGALTFAAVGNATGGPSDTDGPMLPAAWGSLLVESEMCAGIAKQDRRGDGEGRPLVYPVGGVDSHGLDLANARDDSRPYLVAFGDHATTLNAWRDVSPPLTGTSVSTVVVASAVASALAFRPDMQPHEVVDQIWRHGRPRGESAEAWQVRPVSQDAHEIRVCEAVRRIVETTPSSWGTLSLPLCSDGFLPVWPDEDLLEAWDASANGMTEKIYGPFPSNLCAGVDVMNGEPRPPTDPCPQSQHYDITAAPFSGPQPGTTQCQTCEIEVGTGVIRLESDINFRLHNAAGIRLRYHDGRVVDHTFAELPDAFKLQRKVDPAYFENLRSATFTSRIDGTRHTAALTLR